MSASGVVLALCCLSPGSLQPPFVCRPDNIPNDCIAVNLSSFKADIETSRTLPWDSRFLFGIWKKWPVCLGRGGRGGGGTGSSLIFLDDSMCSQNSSWVSTWISSQDDPSFFIVGSLGILPLWLFESTYLLAVKEIANLFSSSLPF